MNHFEKNADRFIDCIGEIIIQNESKPGVLNIARLKQMLECAELVKQIAQGCDAVVTVKLHEPYASMGCICMEVDSLECYNSQLLGKVITLATNVEIYATTQGHVCLVLTFHGLIKRIDR